MSLSLFSPEQIFTYPCAGSVTFVQGATAEDYYAVVPCSLGSGLFANAWWKVGQPFDGFCYSRNLCDYTSTDNIIEACQLLGERVGSSQLTGEPGCSEAVGQDWKNISYSLQNLSRSFVVSYGPLSGTSSYGPKTVFGSHDGVHDLVRVRQNPTEINGQTYQFEVVDAIWVYPENLSAPSVALSGTNILQISAPNSEAERFDVYVEWSSPSLTTLYKTVQKPFDDSDATFDLSTILPAPTLSNQAKIWVRSQALGYAESNTSSLIYYPLAQLATPTLEIDSVAKELTITSDDTNTRRYEIYMDSSWVGYQTRNATAVIYDFQYASGLTAGSEFYVVATGGGYADSAASDTVVYEPQLLAPTLTISGNYADIYDNDGHATKFRLYADDSTVFFVESDVVNRSAYFSIQGRLPVGTHTIVAKAWANNYAESEASNAQTYTVVLPSLNAPTLSISGGTLYISNIDSNATLLRLFQDGVSVSSWSNPSGTKQYTLPTGVGRYDFDATVSASGYQSASASTTYTVWGQLSTPTLSVTVGTNYVTFYVSNIDPNATSLTISTGEGRTRTYSFPSASVSYQVLKLSFSSGTYTARATVSSDGPYHSAYDTAVYTITGV